jgi:branched-subunit amino acid ABC-type transport system permease component
MTLLLQTLIFGVLTGGVYALMSSGFTLIFGVMRVINLAHGALLIMAAYLTWWVWDRTGIDPLLLGAGVSVVMYAVGWLLYRTVIARVQRIDPELALVASCATSRTGAALVGIDVERTMAKMFAIGCATTGFGGAALAVLYQFVPDSHYAWIGRVLCVVVLGGLGSFAGAALGAANLGLGEALTAAYWDSRWITAVPYMLIIAILVVRPQGLLGARTRIDGSTG